MSGARSRRVPALVLALVAGGAWWWAVPPATLPVVSIVEDGRTVRGSLHVHTRRSDGSGTVDEVAAAARRAGLRFVVLADHGDATRPPDPPAYREGVLVVDAVEISTTGGHYVAIGLGRAPYRLAGEPRDVVDDVRRLGGFGIAAHPDSPKPALAWSDRTVAVDGFEWLNADSEWRRSSSTAVVRAAIGYLFRGPQAIAALLGSAGESLARWDALALERRVVGVAGHDAHARLGADNGTANVPGRPDLALPSYQSAFGAFSVHVHLARQWRGDAAEDAAALVAAIRAGHLFTAIDAMAAPAALAFAAATPAGPIEAGDEVRDGAGVSLVARVPAVAGLSLALIANGHPVATTPEHELRYQHPPAGPLTVYRIEARLAGRLAPWLVSNAITVGPRAALPAVEESPIAARLEIAGGAAPWIIERSPSSTVRIGEAQAPWQAPALRVAIRLGPGLPSGQYGALSTHLAAGSLQGFTRVRFRVAADAPARVSVQVRAPRTGERWIRSVYADAQPRLVSVAFDDMTSVETGARGRVPLAVVDSLLFVADTTNLHPGDPIAFWLGDVVVERTLGDQVRTVSSR